MKHFSQFALALSMTAVAAFGGTIIDRSGAQTVANGLAEQGVSFTTTSAFTNVSISAPVRALGTGLGSANIFLMNQIGPGTTVANQIAMTTITGVSSSFSLLNFFSGLSLSAGTYYLLIDNSTSPSAVAFAVNTTNVETLGGGVTPAAFATDKPRARFTVADLRYRFTVTGYH